jgi:hypothetical protein
VLALLALLGLVMPLGTPAANAQGSSSSGSNPGGWAVEPSGPSGPGARSYFIYSLKPGQVFQDTVGISNLSKRTINFVIYPTDAYTVPGKGGFAALRDDQAPKGVGTWIKLATEKYTIPAGKRADIPFQIAIPPDAEPGDHAGAILAIDSAQGKLTPGKSTGLDVRTRVGARVYVRVAGPLEPALRIDQLTVERHMPRNPFGKKGTAVIQARVTNTGNVRLTPTLQVKIKGFLGRTLQTTPERQLPELLPGGNVLITQPVTGLGPWGPLTADVIVTAQDQGKPVSESRSITFYPIPWPTVVLVVVALALFLFWRWRRRRAQPEPTDAVPPRSREKVGV